MNIFKSSDIIKATTNSERKICMQINLGEKIKQLRKRDGRTQEDLANALSVTSQAVSRWEANGGFPDMTLIPSIANYFHVTIDELFGYNGEREHRKNEILRKAEAEIKTDGDNREIIDFLRDAAKEFPADADILYCLGYAIANQLAQNGNLKVSFPNKYAEFDINHNKNDKYISESISVFEKLLTLEDASVSQKGFAVLNLVPLYNATGQEQAAISLADKQVGIDSCKEFLLMLAASGRERSVISCSVMIAFLRYLKVNAIWTIGNDKEIRSSQKAIDLLLSIVNVYNTVIDDGRFGVMHSDLSDLYASCSVIADRMNDRRKAKEFFALAYFHKSEYDNIRRSKTYKYSSWLFADIEFPCNVLPENTMGMLKAFCAKFSDELKQDIKNDSEYDTQNWWD